MLAANPAQFYPQCAHLMVTGEGTKLPSKEYLVSFPGAYQNTGQLSLGIGPFPLVLTRYHDTDPGIAIADWSIQQQPVPPVYQTTVSFCLPLYVVHSHYDRTISSRDLPSGLERIRLGLERVDLFSWILLGWCDDVQ